MHPATGFQVASVHSICVSAIYRSELASKRLLNPLSSPLVESPAAAPVSPHPLFAEQPPRPSPATPQRTAADFLQAFMAENNIRWGEILSGTLIVGCAVGLVISLRSALQETVPYFPALFHRKIRALSSGHFGSAAAWPEGSGLRLSSWCVQFPFSASRL